MNILDNLENEIISLLVKKMTKDTFNIPVKYYDNISKQDLKQNINFNVFYLNKLIDKYLVIVKNLQMIDIDIINLIVKYILINNKLPRYKEKIKVYSVLDTIYYYLGYDQDKHDKKEYKRNNEYFKEKKDKISKLVQEDYYKIFNNIVCLYSK